MSTKLYAALSSGKVTVQKKPWVNGSVMIVFTPFIQLENGKRVTKKIDPIILNSFVPFELTKRIGVTAFALENYSNLKNHVASNLIEVL